MSLKSPSSFVQTDHELVRVSRPKKGVALLEMNRVDALNALNIELMEAINKELTEILSDDVTKVVVITGVGKAFSAGADVGQMSTFSWPDVKNKDFINVFTRVLPQYPLPVLAAINGAALGGGLELAMMCDVIYVSTRARLGQPELSVGTIPGIGGTQRLIRLVGRGRAQEMILTGRIIDAAEAVTIGLAVRAFEPDELVVRTLESAENMARFSKPLLVKAKRCIQQADETALADGLAFERQEFYQTFALHDRLEGMRAFVEKRPPKFEDR